MKTRFRSLEEAIAKVAANAEMLEAAKLVGCVRGESSLSEALEAHQALRAAWEAYYD